MKTTFAAFLALIIIMCVSGCKTTEENYRAAYEKAVAGRDSATALEQTIYGKHRRSMGSKTAIAGEDTVELRTARVAVTEGGGGVREWLRPYCVVVGQFKQLFNAKSMRERLADSGRPRAFVVETAEPYYFVVDGAYADQSEAIHAARALGQDYPVALREPLPFVLHVPGTR